MTTPSEEPTEQQPATQAEPPAASTSAPTGATAPPPHQPYGYPDPAFAPVARAPRAPWVNPAKRAPVAVAAGLAAVLLIGGGFAAGYAAGNHDGHDRIGPVRYMPYDRDHPRMPMGPNFGDRYGPYGQLPTPTPSPSTSG